MWNPKSLCKGWVSANARQREVSTTGASPKSLGFRAAREGGTLYPARLGVSYLAPLLNEITVGGEVGSDPNAGVLRRFQKETPFLALPALREAATEPLSGSLFQKK